MYYHGEMHLIYFPMTLNETDRNGSSHLQFTWDLVDIGDMRVFE